MFAKVPQELLDLYTDLVKNAPSTEAAQTHLLNFVEDAKNIVAAIQQALDAAKARSGQ